MRHICINGKIVLADQPVLLPDNRGFRYGDGLFETMKVYKGQLLLKEFHMERLFTSLDLLKYPVPVLLIAEKLEKEILALCKKNNCEELARVRLSVWRGQGGLYDTASDPEYIIECWPLAEAFTRLNENGLVIGLYPEARKSCDAFSNLKSANFLPYVLAATYAKENKWNDCLVLNQYDRVADSTIANIFICKGQSIITPSLKEGCVNGTMRKYVINQLTTIGYNIQESVIGIAELEEADGIFLTNAINGLQWVAQYGTKTYTKTTAEMVYQKTVQSFFI
jgi:branched-chain amino acid aminotransferase